jgi:hypothetical protein
MGTKRFAAALAALVIGISGGGAQAQIFRPPATLAAQNYTYGFVGYDHYSASGGAMDGGGLGLGWRINRWLGLQGGGQYLRGSGTDVFNGYAEVQLHFPLGSRASIFAAAGGAYAHASASVAGFSVTSDAGGYRAGLGLEYWLAPRWGLHFSAHRQNAGGVVDNFGLNLAYRF